MLEELYTFSRGASGFSLIIVGISLMLQTRKNPAYRHCGTIMVATGFMFCLSALDPVLKIQLDLGNILIAGAIGFTSNGLSGLTQYILGDSRRSDLTRKMHRAGWYWVTAVVLLPLLDYVFRLQPITRGVEDELALSPLHFAASILLYAWPIAVAILSVHAARWNIADVSADFPATKVLLYGAALTGAILVTIAFSILIGNQILYRLAHTVLQLFLLASYFYIHTHPDWFLEVREDVAMGHERNLGLGDSEANLIGKRLTRIMDDGETLYDPVLDLASMASRIGIPAYRLSWFFNNHLKTTFPSWLNAARIAYVCKRLAMPGKATVLEIAMDAGYRSKPAFNTQFKKITGMSPTEYRKKGIDSRI